jgi:hypothetical protein
MALPFPEAQSQPVRDFPLAFRIKEIGQQANDEKAQQDHDQDVHPVHLGHLRFADVMAHVIAMDEIER